MELLVLIAILPGIVMNVACRRFLARKRKPPFWLAFAVALSIAIITALGFFCYALFTTNWGKDSKVPTSVGILIWFVFSTWISLVPTLLVFLYHALKRSPGNT